MKDALKGYLALATGLSEVTRQRAVGAAKALVAQGEATAGQVSSLADDLLVQSRSNREAVTALVKYEVDRALGRVGLASNDEVGELTARIRALEGSVRELHRDLAAAGHGDSSPTRTASAASVPARTAPAGKAASKPPVKTAPVKTASVKTVPVKTASVKTVPAKTAPVKTASVKTVPAKTAPAKRPPAKSERVVKALVATKAPAATRAAKAKPSSAARTAPASANRGA